MTRWVLLSPAPADAEQLVGEVAALPGVRSCSGGPDLPGSMGGLGMTWDVVADEAPRTPGTKELEAELVPLAPIASHRVTGDGPRVKRTLLLAVRPGTPEDVVARFEADLLAMPRHISTIRSWVLSRVAASVPGASTRWTHAWEQEYDDVEGLTGEYLLHPYHWTHVDRWFDAELAESVVEPALAHLYRWVDGPVL